MDKNEIVDSFSHLGARLSHFALLGNPSAELAAVWVPGIGVRELCIEDNAKYHELVEYLRECDVLRFPTGTEMHAYFWAKENDSLQTDSTA